MSDLMRRKFDLTLKVISAFIETRIPPMVKPLIKQMGIPTDLIQVFQTDTNDSVRHLLDLLKWISNTVLDEQIPLDKYADEFVEKTQRFKDAIAASRQQANVPSGKNAKRKKLPGTVSSQGSTPTEMENRNNRSQTGLDENRELSESI